MRFKKHVHGLAPFQVKRVLITLHVFLVLASASAQEYLDRLQQQLRDAKSDTAKVLALGALADYWGFIQFDSSIFYARQTLDLSQKSNYPYGKYLSYYSLFHAMNCKGDYPKALDAAQNILGIAEQLKNEKPWVLPVPHYFLGLLNREVADYPGAISQFQQVIQVEQKTGEPVAEMQYFAYSQLALIYLNLKKPDSALWFAQKGYAEVPQIKRYKKYVALVVAALGNIYVRNGNYNIAEDYFKTAVQLSDTYNNLYFKARNYNNLAELFNKTGNNDSSIYYAKLSLNLCVTHNFAEFTKDASSILSQAYQTKHQQDSALKYLQLMVAANDSVFSQAKGQQYQQYIFKEEQRKQELNAAKERYQNQVRLYSLLAILGVVLLLAFILYRSNRQKQKDKIKIEKAYQDLKATQAQLIQSEKMASLGELTAGIAHEIQNPLNFVNNFSETNVELLTELKEELFLGHIEEVNAIASDIINNEQKVVHHGRRADSIVKKMLQHSRTSKGEKQLTDVNALAEEYLQLAYHGFRAKDKSFNATIETDFDDRIKKINLVPQDIGRVLLNIFNNAFYAVHEQLKKLGQGYMPIVSVSTRKLSGKIELVVKDNGMGISKSVMDKIFQPFFTTKPTGEGTGLGLSLSYDIIKAHSGELKVESNEGEGSVFTIVLAV